MTIRTAIAGALLLAASVLPATGGDGTGYDTGYHTDHGEAWYATRTAIAEREKLIAMLEADSGDGRRLPRPGDRTRAGRDHSATRHARCGAMAFDLAVLLQPQAALYPLSPKRGSLPA